MDVSDGLAKDFDRMCRASDVGGELSMEKIPLSQPARALLRCGATTLARLATGGEDYEVLAAVPPERAAAFAEDARRAGTPVTQIGTIVGGNVSGATFVDGEGRVLSLDKGGWDHFSGNA
jgi:thiamine-monophosphate kinase